MNNLPFISIIIPVYCVEPYIEDCIRSVMAQDYQGRLECIVVDDCGSDNSMKIVREVIATNNSPVQFHIIQHDRNRGLSAARNTGMKAAQGEYCYFLDSDDEITRDCIRILVAPLLKKFYDMVIGEYMVIGVEDKFSHLHWEDGAYIGHEEISNGYYYRKWFQIAVTKLYNLGFLRKHNQLFLEGVIHEDELWSAELACLIESVYVVNKPTYIYKVRPGSITTANNYSRRKEAYYNMIPSFVKFLENNQLLNDCYSIAIFDTFVMLFWWISKKQNSFGCKQCYKDIRSLINFPAKLICYRQRGFSKKLLRVHYCFSPSFGYYVKQILDYLVKLKNYIKS